MKFLIVGLGSIGRRHVTNLRSLYPDSLIDVYDSNSTRISEFEEDISFHEVKKDAVKNQVYDCVFICTPPSSHVEISLMALRIGSNVFIEKPISSTSKDLDELTKIVEEKNLLAFVGFNLRFHKATNTIREMITEKKFGKLLHASAYFGQYLPDWRPWQDYRQNYTAQRKLGGGIIQDASHEVDYLRWLIGEPISVYSDFVYSESLEADSEAIADVILKFKNNILAQIHLDFIRREYKRSLELLFENGIIQWNYSKSVIETFDGINKSWNTIKIEEPDNEMYLKELEHVINCIETKTPSKIIDLNNGITTFKISSLIKKSK